jgi:hypothetical protein
MSVLAALAGNAQNIIYSGGLYVVDQALVDQSPITSSISVSGPGGSATLNRNWIGYFLSPTSGTVSMAITTTASAGGNDASAVTQGRLWLGSNAATGSNGTADILATNNQTSGANFSLTQGVYYPLRIRWTGTYQGGGTNFFPTPASGSIIFASDGSSDVSGRIFYNNLSNGF